MTTLRRIEYLRWRASPALGVLLLAVAISGCSSAGCTHSSFGSFSCQQVLDAASRDVGPLSGSVRVLDVPSGAPARTAPDIALVVETDGSGAQTLIMVGKRSIDPELHAWVVDSTTYLPPKPS
jgi:hypothetical protein